MSRTFHTRRGLPPPCVCSNWPHPPTPSFVPMTCWLLVPAMPRAGAVSACRKTSGWSVMTTLTWRPGMLLTSPPFANPSTKCARSPPTCSSRASVAPPRPRARPWCPTTCSSAALRGATLSPLLAKGYARRTASIKTNGDNDEHHARPVSEIHHWRQSGAVPSVARTRSADPTQGHGDLSHLRVAANHQEGDWRPVRRDRGGQPWFENQTAIHVTRGRAQAGVVHVAEPHRTGHRQSRHRRRAAVLARRIAGADQPTDCGPA